MGADACRREAGGSGAEPVVRARSRWLIAKNPAGRIVSGIYFSGVREIRTPGTLLAHTRFPGVPLQPLEHHSNFYVLSLFRKGYQ